MKDFKTTTEAFDEYLKELALAEFPTGNGNWRNNLKFQSDLIGAGSSDDPQLLTTESLKELSEKKPFNKDVEWSKNVKRLQEKCMTKPESVDKENIHLYFKHLRLVDKNINVIDANLRKFSNLSELIVSANQIESVNSSSLPSKLKVLELCGNQISDLENLSNHPPSLQHLGLSFNRIHCLSIDQLNPVTWDCMLSLDLSFNYLKDIAPLIGTLSQLPKLRNLLLQGNPIFLFPGYRGYTVDSIKSLTLFDDVRISADERHLFKGLSKLKDLPFSEFLLFMELDNVRGIHKAPETEVQEDYPKTVSKYIVEIDFIENFEIIDKEEFLKDKTENNENEQDGQEEEVTMETRLPSTTCIENDIPVALIKTHEFLPTENDVINLNFSKAIRSSDQCAMHKHLCKPFEIRVVENRVVLSNEPKPAVDKSINKEPSKGSGKNKSKVFAPKKEDKEKQAAATKGGKAKKQQDVELFEWSRTSHTIAFTTLDLQHLLIEESTSLKCDVTLQRHHVPHTVKDDECTTLSSFEESFSKKDLTSKKKGGGGGGKEEHRNSNRSVTSTTRSRTKANKVETPTPLNDAPPTHDVGPDISLNITLELKRWRSAKDGLVWIQNNPK